jgi:hypothetical protein
LAIIPHSTLVPTSRMIFCLLRSERFLSAQRQNRHCQLGSKFINESPVRW